MEFEDFWVQVDPNPSDVWGSARKRLNLGFVNQLASTSKDLGQIIALVELARDEFIERGTSNQPRIDNSESKSLLRAVKHAAQRLSIPIDFPFRDFDGFYRYWLDNDAYGSWQARREIVNRIFDPVLDTLEDRQERAFMADLASAATDDHTISWAEVRESVNALRERYRHATTSADYSDVGNRAVAVIESLSAVVFDPAVHWDQGYPVPPVDKTNIRLEAFVDSKLPGSSNAEIRGLAKKSIALAHKVKHWSSSTKVEAGIAADSAILLASILSHLDQS